MADSFITCRDYRATIPLSLLKISELCDIPSRFYESLNEKNRMCELCTFSQIWSHILMIHTHIAMIVALLPGDISITGLLRMLIQLKQKLILHDDMPYKWSKQVITIAIPCVNYNSLFMIINLFNFMHQL